MEAELMTLAASGATTVVGLMATEAWTQVRGRLARFLSRGEGTDAVDAELEESRAELTAARADADEATAADIEAEWRTRLRRALRANPEAAEELRTLLDELAPLQPSAPTVSVSNSVSGGTQYAPVVQGQNISHFTLNGSGVTAPEQRPGAE